MSAHAKSPTIKYSVKISYAITDLVCLEIPKQCIGIFES